MHEEKEIKEPEKPVPADLEEAAKEYAKGEGLDDALGGWEDMHDAFIAGAKWQYQKDRERFAQIKAKTWCEGFDACKEQMMKGAVDGEVVSLIPERNYVKVERASIAKATSGFKEGDKVRIIIVKED